MTFRKRAAAWFEDRTGYFGAFRKFLEDPVPRGTGWKNTFGSVAGALLLLQILTGVLLALYYVPHPDAAYASVEYVVDEMIAGGMIRSLHYWGASFIMVALFVHAVRVFLTGAYRPPRELNWIVGVFLFITVAALAFTGQLLPWNEDGYWAAKVGVEVGSSVPLIGPYVKRLILGGETLGALTLSRFYALHIVVLPFVLGVLTFVHLQLLRRFGPARPSTVIDEGSVPFYPAQLARDLIAISVVFAGLLVAVVFVGGPYVEPADPTNTNIYPRPEWYFLSHFELLRLTPGSLKLLTTFVLPSLFIIALLALPWIDRGKTNAWSDRRPTLTAGLIAIFSIVGLTAYGVVTIPEAEAPDEVAMAPAETTEPSAEIPANVQRGRSVFQRLRCLTCHQVEGRGEAVGPDLSGVGLRLQAPYLRKWLRNPTAFVPETTMPPVTVQGPNFEALVEYLMSLRTEPEGID